MAIDREAWDARIRAAVEELTPQLLASSHDIHANPELAFREHRASARLADELEQGGFAVEREAGGLPTAFRAELNGGEPGPTIAILAEYDALPGIGHGCGHNVIATSALGAGLALARAGGAVPGHGPGGRDAGRGGRRRQDPAGRGRRLRGRGRGYMLHPSQTNMVEAGLAGEQPGRGRVPRTGGARGRRAGPGHQRARGGDPDVRRGQRPAAAHARRRPSPRDHHGRRQGGEHHPGPGGGAVQRPRAGTGRTSGG